MFQKQQGGDAKPCGDEGRFAAVPSCGWCRPAAGRWRLQLLESGERWASTHTRADWVERRPATSWTLGVCTPR